MVQVVDLPVQPQDQTGFDLAQVFQQGAAGYVQQQQQQRLRAQQLADEATARQNQLSDVQSARDYKDQTDATARAYDRTDFDYRQAANERATQMHEKGELKIAVTQALVNNGYLSPDKIDDPASVAAAWSAASHDGLIAKYSDLVNHGYLTIDKIGDPQAVADAQGKAASASTSTYQAGLESKSNAQTLASEVSAQHQKTLAALQQVEAEATKDPEQVTPDPQAVANLAAQLARQANKPGAALTPQMIAEQQPAAEQQLREQGMYQQQQRTAQAKAILPALQRQAASEDTRLTQFEKLGVFADPGDPAASGAPAAGPALAQPGGPPAASAQQAAFAALTKKPLGAPGSAPYAGVGAPPPPTPPALAPLPNPTGAPVIATENASRAAQAQNLGAQAWQKNLANPYDDSLDKIADLKQQIAAVSRPDYQTNPTPGHTPQSPSDQAKDLSDLLAQLSIEQQKLEMRRKAMLGITATGGQTGPMTVGMPQTGSPSAAPAFSDPSGSAPVPAAASAGPDWWGGAQPY